MSKPQRSKRHRDQEKPTERAVHAHRIDQEAGDLKHLSHQMAIAERHRDHYRAERLRDRMRNQLVHIRALLGELDKRTP